MKKMHKKLSLQISESRDKPDYAQTVVSRLDKEHQGRTELPCGLNYLNYKFTL